MNRIVCAISLLLTMSLCHADNDIWTSLFKEKLREAGSGDSEAQYDVGTMYQNGRGVAPDRDKAMEWYQKAAAQNNARAVSRMQLMKENAARFDRTRALAGQGNADSQYELGNMYMMGVGVDIDYQNAISQFERSASQGNIKAAFKLGLIYYEGTGTRPDSRAAFKWFGVAAQHGYPAAQYYFGRMYAEGKGTARNNQQALQWLHKAVDGGFEQARGELINVTENINMEKSAASTQSRPEPAAAPVVAAAEPKPAPQAKVVREKPHKTASRETEDKQPKQYNLDDLMSGAWNRDNDPVAYLPSSINNCRTEEGKLICFSEDQSHRTGNNIIRFKTKAIVDKFSNSGHFKITYRNLVIEATPITGDDQNDSSGMGNYTVKTGWGSPHILECSFKSDSALSCVKNDSYSFVLNSQHTVASRR